MNTDPDLRSSTARVVRYLVFLLACACSTQVAAGCSPCPLPSTWESLGSDASNSNFNPNETALNWNNVQTAAPKWSLGLAQQPGDAVWNIYSIVASTDTVYVTLDVSRVAPLTARGVVAANAASGQLRWVWNLSNFELQLNGIPPEPYPFTVLRAHAYVNKSDDAGFWSLDPLTGSSIGVGNGGLANSGMEQAPTGGPKASGSALIYAGGDGGLKAIANTPPGTALWSVSPVANRWFRNPLAVGNGRVYAVMEVFPGTPQWQTHILYAYNGQTGAQVWMHAFPTDTYMSPPSFANGSVYIKGRSLSNVNTLYRLDAATGAVLASTGGAAISNFTLAALE